MSYGTILEGRVGFAPTHRRFAANCLKLLGDLPVERSAGFAPAPPRWQRGILLKRTPIAWWSCGDLNPRSAVCKTAVLPIGRQPHVRNVFSFQRQPQRSCRRELWGEQPVSIRCLRFHKPTCRPLHYARHGATPQIRTEPLRFTKAALVLTSLCGVPEERFELPTVSL